MEDRRLAALLSVALPVQDVLTARRSVEIGGDWRQSLAGNRGNDGVAVPAIEGLAQGDGVHVVVLNPGGQQVAHHFGDGQSGMIGAAYPSYAEFLCTLL